MWILLIVFAVVFVLLVGVVQVGRDDIKAAKAAGLPVQSIWWHIKEGARKAEEEKKARKETKVKEAALKRIGLDNFSDSSSPSQPHGKLESSNSELKAKAASKSLRGSLRFTYEDAAGNITSRELVNWSDSGEYIEGYCLDRGDFRTFRRDRIISFIEGEHLLQPKRRVKVSTTYTVPSVRAPRPMEILFTGFDATTRRVLEHEATEHGLKVRKTVSQKLDFICAGPNPGPSKMFEAEARGARVLDEASFYELLENGVLPVE